MSVVTPTWLDSVLRELQGLRIKQKSARRIRVDISSDAAPECGPVGVAREIPSQVP